MSQQSIHDRIMARESGPRISPEDDKLLKSSKRTIRTITFTLAGLVLVAVVGFAAYQLPQVQQVFAQPATAQKTPDPALPDTPFLAHVKQAGLSVCANVFPILGQLLTNGAKYDIVSQWNKSAPDQYPIQALVGLEYEAQSYTGPAGGVVMAVPNETSCQGAMIRVTPLTTMCSNVATRLPQGSKITNTLGKVSVYTLGQNGGQVLLVPARDSCVAVSVATVK